MVQSRRRAPPCRDYGALEGPAHRGGVGEGGGWCTCMARCIVRRTLRICRVTTCFYKGFTGKGRSYILCVYIMLIKVDPILQENES